MTDEIKIVEYVSATVGDKPGEGRRLLEHISEQGISLAGFAAIPVGGGLTQLNFVADRSGKLQAAATDAGVELSGPERAFLIEGEDRIGALHQHHLTLANAGINVYTSSGVCDGKGHFYFLLWVKPEDFDRALHAFDFV
jgi:hypothetical protein